MNRHLEFRAWDSEQRRMLLVEDEFPIYYEEDNGFHSGKDDKHGDWLNLPIMQWTGHVDKNRNKIFEDDIIMTPMGNLVRVFFGTKAYQTKTDRFEFSGWLVINLKTNQIETLDSSILEGEVVLHIYLYKN